MLALLAGAATPLRAAVAAPGGQIIPVSAPGPGYVNDDQHPFPYLLFVPSSYVSTGAACPLVVCLDGDGEVGNGSSDGTLTPSSTNQLAYLLGNGPLSLIAQGSTYFGTQGVLVLEPQSVLRDDPGYSANRVDLTLHLVLAGYHIDPARIYTMGLGAGAGGLVRWAYAHGRDPAYQMAAIVPIGNVQGLGTTYTDFSQFTGAATWFVNDSDDTVGCPLFTTGRLWNGYGDGWAGSIARALEQAVAGGALEASSAKARCLTTHPDVAAIAASNFNTTTIIPASSLSGTWTGSYQSSNPAGWTCAPGEYFAAGSRLQLTLRQGGGQGGWTQTFGSGGTPNLPFWTWLLAQRLGQVPTGFPTSITAIRLTPAHSNLTIGQSLQFSATAVTAQGVAVSSQPYITWSCSAGGSISGDGLFQALQGPGTTTLTASLPGTGLSATAQVTIANAVLGSCTLWPQGGNVSGCGMLARYAGPGPGTVTIERDTTLGQDAGLPPITLITVIDPTGHTAAWSEITDQSTATLATTLPVPAGPAGIWRFSVEGGRPGDRILFTLPPSSSTGIRGEMALGQVAGAARSGWLWVPSGTGTVLIEALGGGSVTIRTAAGTTLPGTLVGPRTLWRWTALPTGTAVQVEIAAGTQAVAIDGMPGLICPDAATAADLQGGTSVVSGSLVSGPLQARARAWMVAALAQNLAPGLVFPANPAPQADPLPILQLYGNYGPLSGLQAACAAQVLDPTSTFFGSLGGTPDGTIHGPIASPYDANGLAAAVCAGPALNPAHGNAALITRTALLAFYHLSHLQGDDLIRAEDITADGYPMPNAFFTYLGSITGPYSQMSSLLDAQSAAIWRDGVIDVGDRLAGFQGYETNQWWQVILGHLQVYLATGETRFRHWFEIEAGALLNRPANSTSQLGQHPAGYFLEDCGPDGNYDAISDTCLCEAWHDYRALPDADPLVVAMLQDALTRNLGFTSCHWLQQPDGSLLGPTAMATRKVTAFASQGWPGTMFARDGQPLAAAQWLLTPVPVTSIGVAEAFPHMVNTMAWANRALAIEVPAGATLETTAARGIPAEWTHEAIRTADLPMVAPATIPCQVVSGLWDLPGQVAWKQGGLYGLVFYGVPGASVLVPPANCRLGGAPSALWSPSTGTFLLSLHNTHFEDGSPVGDNGVATADDLTHACVYGLLNGAWWYSGHEVAAMAWTAPGSAFSITGSAVAAPSAPVTWTYAYAAGELDLTASVTLAGLTGPTLSLPFPLEAAGATLSTSAPGTAQFTTSTGSVTVLWEGGVAATITAPLATGILATPTPSVSCLRIPLLGSGTTWSQHVRFLLPSAGGGAGNTSAGTDGLTSNATTAGSTAQGGSLGASATGAGGAGGGCGVGGGVGLLLLFGLQCCRRRPRSPMA